VRRDRAFIESEYAGQQFPDGTPVRFPTPHLTTRRYDLDAAHHGLVEQIASAIDALTMARYRPSAFDLTADELAVETQLAGLLRSAVLKRFESCWRACLETVERMLVVHEAFLLAWSAGHVASRATLRDAARAEAGESGLAGWVAEALEGDTEARPASEFDPSYGDAVSGDRDQLSKIRDALSRLDAAATRSWRPCAMCWSAARRRRSSYSRRSPRPCATSTSTCRPRSAAGIGSS
jgi:hypothetical protein